MNEEQTGKNPGYWKNMLSNQVLCPETCIMEWFWWVEPIVFHRNGKVKMEGSLSFIPIPV
jgi:hypothetical protein